MHHDQPSYRKVSLARRLLKFFHPEAIPWPGSGIYNLISATELFQHHYELVAKDIMHYGLEGALLDIGTGPGWLLLKIHKGCPRIRLVGMDASPSMVARARKNMTVYGLSDSIDIRKGNARNIPFKKDSFEIVVSTGSIHHWKAPIVALNDVYRVLKPDGHALIYDLVSDTPKAVINEMSREFGWLRTKLFWIHGFEEPFYCRREFEALARSSLFRESQRRFVGLLYCLVLEKGRANDP